jgi:hypothetical protein
VSYQQILESLVGAREGFRAAVLLDPDGETVVSAGREGDPHSHKVLGAYQGIYLRDLARALTHCGLGLVEFFSFHTPEFHVFTESLVEGYYLVLLAAESVAPGIARKDLSGAAARLREIW